MSPIHSHILPTAPIHEVYFPTKLLSALQNIFLGGYSKGLISGPAVIEDGAFKGLGSLTALDLAGTRLATIQNGTFAGLDQLEILSLNHNDALVKLASGAFRGMRNLDYLHLNNNRKLTTIESGAVR